MIRRLRMRPAMIAGMCVFSLIAAGATGEFTGSPDWGLAVLGVCAVIVTAVLKLAPSRTQHSRGATLDDLAAVYQKIDNAVKDLGKIIQRVSDLAMPRESCKLQEANVAQRLSAFDERIGRLEKKIDDLCRIVERNGKR
jgi:hypothetical protein